MALVPLLATWIITQRLSHRPFAAPEPQPSKPELPEPQPSKPQPSKPVKLGNPIDLKSALLYSGGLTLLLVLVRAAQAWLGASGIYLLSALSGIADVDAVSLSLAASANNGLSTKVAAQGILLAVAVNTLVKATIVLAIGGWQLARWSTSILLLSLSLGFITLLIV
jgi:uncharacterized membrane protein (DUF4010 family)